MGESRSDSLFFYMYLDGYPELAYSRLMRSKARGVPIRDSGRACAIAWMADGSMVPADTIVRFDVAEGEKAPRRLADAFTQTSARAIRFFGGDDVVRGAIRGLELMQSIDGGAYVFRHAPSLPHSVRFREPGMRDTLAVGELVREQAASFTAPKVSVAEIGNEAVGVGITDEVDKHWIEMRVAVFPAFRGRGFGASIIGALADEFERKEGRLICAGIHQVDERARITIERGGFRLVDYYFTAERVVR
jgi:GNAT superfamily N-acetyltransferase